MRPPRHVWLLLGLIAVLFVLGALLWQGKPQERSGEAVTTPNHTSYNSGPSGLRALWLTLQRLDYEVRRARKPFSQSALPEQGRMLVVEPLAAVAPREWRALLEWVAAGNTLLLASEMALPNRTIVSYRIFSQEAVTRARPIQLSHLAQGVRALAVRSRIRMELAPTRQAGQRGKTREREGFPLGRGGSLAGPWEKLAGAVPVFEDDAGAVVSYARLGQGQVILLGSPWSLSNRGIGRTDNLRFVLNALGRAEGGPVYFDEFHHGYGESALWGLLSPPLKLALVNLAFGLLVGLYACSRRFGRIVPLERESRQRSEFLTTMTTLLRKGRATRLTVRLALEAAQERLRRELGVSARGGPEDLVRMASRLNPQAGQRLEQAFRDCRLALQTGTSLAEGRAINLVRQLDEAVASTRKL